MKFQVLTLGLIVLLASIKTVSSRTLTADELNRLFGNDKDGTTLVVSGNSDKVFFSRTWTNHLRRSKALGPRFMRDKIRKDTFAEGIFLGSFGGDKADRKSGVAGIIADKSSGNGILLLIETFAGDKSMSAFQGRKRQYMLLLVSEDDTGLTCKTSNWNQLGGKSDGLKFSTNQCEFVIGDAVTN